MNDHWRNDLLLVIGKTILKKLRHPLVAKRLRLQLRFFACFDETYVSLAHTGHPA